MNSLRIAKAEAKTAAIVILSAVDVSTEQLEQGFADQKEVRPLIRRIRRALTNCWAQVKSDHKPLSAAAERKMDSYWPRIDKMRHEVLGGPCTTPESWASWVFALDALITEVRAVWRPAKSDARWTELGTAWGHWTEGMMEALGDGVDGPLQLAGEELYETISGELPRMRVM